MLPSLVLTAALSTSPALEPPAPPAPAAVVAPPTPQQRGGRAGRGQGSGDRSRGGNRSSPRPPGFPPILPPVLFPAPAPQPAPVQPQPDGARDGQADRPRAAVVPLGELPELAELELEYFRVADYDGSDWISYREAIASLDVDRGEFRSFDDDRDGRIDRGEFGQRVRETVDLVGSFRPPRPFVPPQATPNVSETLLQSVDVDGDDTLSVFELQAAFDSFNARDLDAQLVLSSFDADLSGSLDAEEFADIARALREGTFAIAPAPSEPPSSIDELFGVPVPRRTLPGTASSTLPPRLVGPVSHFYRLDFDRDGAIRPEDLLRLQAPLHLEVRARAIVAFLDGNGDGSLDREELRAAFE